MLHEVVALYLSTDYVYHTLALDLFHWTYIKSCITIVAPDISSNMSFDRTVTKQTGGPFY